MKKIHILYFLLALTFLVGACAPGQSTPNVDDLAGQIETSVALTVAAGDALTAAAVPTNTETPLPATSTPFPTLTPFPTVRPFLVTPGTGNGNGSSGGGGGGGPTPDPRYQCQLIDQKPLDGAPATILKLGDTLDVKWTLKNTGTKKWDAATYSWKFIGEKVRSDIPANTLLSTNPFPLQSNIGLVDIKPGEFVTLVAELNAPANFDGNKPIWITVQYAIVGDGVKFCTPYIQVEIIKPGMTP